MRKTYVTKMPDKAGAFLVASRIVAGHGGNIVRVNYNKAVDLHTLFIEVYANEEQHKLIESELTECGYLVELSEDASEYSLLPSSTNYLSESCCDCKYFTLIGDE